MTSDRLITDLTPLPDLPQRRSRTGPVREQRPVYVDLLPPCNAGCAAGENIQGWLAQVKDGEHEQAWRVLTTRRALVPARRGRWRVSGDRTSRGRVRRR
jgi:formate dehydrogenase (NADP+) beta subunit